MENKKVKSIFDEEDIADKPKQQKPMPTQKKKAKIILILPARIVLEDSLGNGISIPFIKEKHAGLRVGDYIEI